VTSIHGENLSVADFRTDPENKDLGCVRRSLPRSLRASHHTLLLPGGEDHNFSWGVIQKPLGRRYSCQGLSIQGGHKSGNSEIEMQQQLRAAFVLISKQYERKHI
jgi:hypothetical protein